MAQRLDMGAAGYNMGVGGGRVDPSAYLPYMPFTPYGPNMNAAMQTHAAMLSLLFHQQAAFGIQPPSAVLGAPGVQHIPGAHAAAPSPPSPARKIKLKASAPEFEPTFSGQQAAPAATSAPAPHSPSAANAPSTADSADGAQKAAGAAAEAEASIAAGEAPTSG